MAATRMEPKFQEAAHNSGLLSDNSQVCGKHEIRAGADRVTTGSGDCWSAQSSHSHKCGVDRVQQPEVFVLGGITSNLSEYVAVGA